MKRYVKLFEDFQGPALDIMGVADLLKKGDFASAKELLHDIIGSSEENTSQYEASGLPPVELEEACGISGISKMWKMPFGFTNREVEFLFRMFMEDRSDKKNTGFILDSMKASNPDLKIPGWLYDKSGDMQVIWNIVVGCTSAMNLPDMLFYTAEFPEIVEMPSKGSGYLFKVSGRVDEGYSDLYTRAQIASEYNIGWCPCVETLELIIEKLEERA